MNYLFPSIELLFLVGVGFFVIHQARKTKEKEMELVLTGETKRQEVSKKYDQKFLLGSAVIGIRVIRFLFWLVS